MSALWAWIVRIFAEVIVGNLITLISKLWQNYIYNQKEEKRKSDLDQVAQDLKKAKEAGDDKAQDAALDRIVDDYNR